MPTAAEPNPSPVFMITDPLYRLAIAVLAASTLAFLVVVVAGVLAEEVLPDLGPVWPGYLLARELIGVTIIGVVAGAAVIGPARTARQVALGALLITASREPGARLVVPDPRGPVGRSPFLPATVTAIGWILGAISTLAVLSDQPGATTARGVLITALVVAVIAVPLLGLAARRWRKRSAPLLDGQLAAPAAAPPVGSTAPPASARPGRGSWLPWPYAAGLVIFFGALFLRRPDQESEPLSFGEPVDSVIDVALQVGGGLIIAAVLLTVITRLARAIRESIMLRRMINGPVDPGHAAPERELTGVAPAIRGSLLCLGAAVWFGELLLGLGRLDHVRDPLLTEWQARLPQLLTGWWLVLVLIIAATAAAGVLDSRWRNRARGIDDRLRERTLKPRG